MRRALQSDNDVSVYEGEDADDWKFKIERAQNTKGVFKWRMVEPSYELHSGVRC
jgi:hypothetical protein